MEYLVHHAHQFHKPDSFADEVQHHLDNWATPEDTENQTESSQDQAISNLSQHAPPVIPSAPNAKLPGF